MKRIVRKMIVRALIIALILICVGLNYGEKETNQTTDEQENVSLDENNSENSDLNKEQTTLESENTTSDKEEVDKDVSENNSQANDNSGEEMSPAQSATEHTHNWVAQTQTVVHEATGHNEQVLVKEAWTEEIPVFEEQAREICNRCGEDITSNYIAHEKAHALVGEGGGRHTEYHQVQTGTKTIHHPAEYTDQWVVDQEAWTETVTIGYKCSSCGISK